MTVREANDVTGKLSKPSKMPCKSYSLPAKECKIGSLLRGVKGSTCKGCYAMKGFYVMPVVEKAMYRRLDSLKDPHWVQAMVILVGREKSGYFRWHDSGDIQSLEHLKDICKVAELTPHIKHWLPTREIPILKAFKKAGLEYPDNLTVRVSDHFIGQIKRLNLGLPTSGVHLKEGSPQGFRCSAPKQDGECRDCRACWSKEVGHVSYLKH